MLKTKAIFERKTDDFEPKDCIIEKTVRLTAAKYDVFSKNMLADYDFIKDNIDLMHCDSQGAYHCLLVVGEDRPDGLLIESEGYGYGRYSAFLPNAADFLEAHPEQEQAKKEQQSAPDFKLQDLMRIPLEDIHLVHSDEDIELATIVELKSDTLTEAGRKEWADVLNADVVRIFDGIYGVQVECNGVDPQRLSDFSFMLAGQCSSQDYEKWVAQEPPEAPDMQMKQL
ncbi:DUF6329 domain-containing protein [Desulfosporosinus metallidurans]|uniref:DUF6329 domain-containing protein n=1 Tax=Desulfosporosinus metallidurans TaxID=1888891 RepID=A0A1Q8QS21_9FIRM|nr:DUF6329 domain-containing protein [Desulfosporosinus metallidurans]OLN30100.1 hypothetical protein DSOL_3232 [Desulfosporosinus metallidurans]